MQSNCPRRKDHFFLLANSIGPYDYRMLLAIIFALATSICTARRSSSTVGKAFVREPGGEGLVTLVIGPYLYPSGQWVMELHMIWEQTIWNLSDGPDSGCVSNCLKSTKMVDPATNVFELFIIGYTLFIRGGTIYKHPQLRQYVHHIYRHNVKAWIVSEQVRPPRTTG